MGKFLGKKGLVVGLAAIFLTLAIIPAMGGISSMGAEDNEGLTKWSSTEGNEDAQKGMVEVEVTEYNPDGTIGTKQISLRQKEAVELKSKLYTAKKIGERFSLLKKYGLVPQNTALEDLEIGMHELMDKTGITKQKILKDISSYEGLTDLKLPILLTFLSHVDAVYLLGNSLRVGSTPVTMALNRLFGWNIKGIDVIDVCWGTLGIINVQGMLGNHAFVCMPSYMFMAGFVGYAVKFPLSYHIFSGYSIATFAAGIGIHDFQPISS